MRFFGKRELEFDRPLPPARVTLDAIGFVRNDVIKPRPNGWEEIESRIELKPIHAARVEHLDAYSHILVIFYMDLAEEAPEKPERMKLASGTTYGIFATRSQLRPNHLGVSAVRLASQQGTTLNVVGLDAVDGTPVLDVKPYLPDYDAIFGAEIPGG